MNQFVGNLNSNVQSIIPTQNTDVLNDITSKCTDSFMCHICGKHFAHSSSLYRHRKVHPGLLSGSISCREKHCPFSCRTLQDLREHLQYIHNKNMDEETKEFDTFEGTEIIARHAERQVCTDTFAV